MLYTLYFIYIYYTIYILYIDILYYQSIKQSLDHAKICL